MKIEGSITLLINPDYTTIEIQDVNAQITFCRMRLTPEQLSAILSKQGMVSIQEMHVAGLDLIGKKQENKIYEFEINQGGRNEEILYQRALSSLKENGMAEWEPDNYFRSQNSLFTKDGKSFARCTIRRWV